jgi:hypothetical protein
MKLCDLSAERILPIHHKNYSINSDKNQHKNKEKMLNLKVEHLSAYWCSCVKNA